MVEIAHIAAEVIIGGFVLAYLVVWWLARRQSAARMSLAVVAPLMVAVAYLVSEVLKVLFQEERPCRGVVGCPEVGDWSFPSNHATIAGAAAVGLLLVHRVMGVVAVALAILVAVARVVEGVHYPHDVLAGLLLGAGLAFVAGPLARVMTPVVARLRARSGGALLLGR
ncbi:phosphatase PAP2 family protein [Kibdelosporangium phytohabitans]|uniref:Phosphatidic acid phosphatase type 2/haloperoxidase domain-containing protein n=1 Tax=Kibdelosporangium phytohabitans TaxID=860235 RepID=A0A0N9I6F3_9PSEU|nr:phosphatase PAP2 family protein [Kibdelosporangium phytohabitans]ALG13713.1 hypothetical protein AOZ06_48745 [Kibdelosporangium phytohabitans]MBE1465604.1 undecaprenyl-diphosphatase [Kibdelosporangium phytohabitans]